MKTNESTSLDSKKDSSQLFIEIKETNGCQNILKAAIRYIFII